MRCQIPHKKYLPNQRAKVTPFQSTIVAQTLPVLGTTPPDNHKKRTQHAAPFYSSVMVSYTWRITCPLATTPDNAPAPVSEYPAYAPWIPASAAQFPYPSFLEPHTPAVSDSCDSPANIPPKAPDSQSSCPSPKPDGLPRWPSSPSGPHPVSKPCGRRTRHTRPRAAALRASHPTISPAPEYQSPR